MSEDLVSLLIYLALALVGVIASAYKSRAAKRQQMNKPQAPQVPRTFEANPGDLERELGPLAELFDIPRQQPNQEPEYESIEDGPSVEETDTLLDSPESVPEISGMDMSRSMDAVDEPSSEVETFEEGQSDIQKMIAKYDALRKQYESDYENDDIANSEIVSVEAEEEAKQKRNENREFFDARKAIIYSEILKKRDF